MITQEVGGTTYYTVSGLYDLTQMREAGGGVLQVERWKPGVWRLHVRFSKPLLDRSFFRVYYCADEFLRRWVAIERELETKRHAVALAQIAAWEPPGEAL